MPIKRAALLKVLPVLFIYCYEVLNKGSRLENQPDFLERACTFNRHTRVQLRKMNVIPLVNKPYLDEVTLSDQNLY